MNSDPHAPMDTQLLQLERELFSLTPVETPRHVASRLDRQVLGPVSIGRQIAASPKVIPFQWKRIMVPAAAAVVAVSVLNHLDTPASRSSDVAQSNPGFLPRADGQVRMSPSNGYVLRAEPVLISPGTWQGIQQHYFIQPGAVFGSGYNTSQRASGLSPVVFH